MTTQKDFIAKLVRLLTEVDSIKESIKEVKDAIKKAEFDPAILTAVAAAIVKNDVDALLTKSNDIIDAVELARS